MFSNGTRVQLKQGAVHQPWFEQDKQYTGVVVGHVDGNVIVRLDESVMFDGKPMCNFSFQSTSLEQPEHPEACLCDECDAIRFAFCGYDD